MVLGAGFDEDVATHAVGVNDGHDLVFEGAEATAAVDASVHLRGQALLGADGGLDDVEEGAHRAVHFLEQGVSAFHFEVGKDAVVVLEVAGVNPLCGVVDASGGDLVAGGNHEVGDNVNQGAAHVDAAVWTFLVQDELVGGEARDFGHASQHLFGG